MNATVYHYGYRCEKYESYYNEDGKPKGVWIEKRDNGTYYLDFDKGEAYFKNDQTGFVEGMRPIKGFWQVQEEISIPLNMHSLKMDL